MTVAMFGVLATSTGLDVTLRARTIVVVALGLVMVWTVFGALRRTTRPVSSQLNLCSSRLANKTLALFVGWLIVLLVATLGSSLNIAASRVFLDDAALIVPFLPLLIPLYIVVSEKLLGSAEDSHSSIGAWLRRRGKWEIAHKTVILGWLVKAFFLPLMYGNLVLAIQQLLSADFSREPSTWIAWFFLFGVSVDLLVATIGYLSTGKLFGAEIRSVDDSWKAWVVCLVCYAPFFQYVKLVTEQRDALIWSDWLRPDEAWYWIWAALLFCSWSTYWLSSIAFGNRFSNLTYRGLIDRGPYQYLKHPAYLSKNIYWWLHTVPFFGVLSSTDLAANVAGLSAVSLIYYARAKTEERHLLQFPEYATYARRLNERSLSRRLRLRFAQGNAG